jgi:hypothetical protein
VKVRFSGHIPAGDCCEESEFDRVNAGRLSSGMLLKTSVLFPLCVDD